MGVYLLHDVKSIPDSTQDVDSVNGATAQQSLALQTIGVVQVEKWPVNWRRCLRTRSRIGLHASPDRARPRVTPSTGGGSGRVLPLVHSRGRAPAPAGTRTGRYAPTRPRLAPVQI